MAANDETNEIALVSVECGVVLRCRKLRGARFGIKQCTQDPFDPVLVTLKGGFPCEEAGPSVGNIVRNRLVEWYCVEGEQPNG